MTDKNNFRTKYNYQSNPTLIEESFGGESKAIPSRSYTIQELLARRMAGMLQDVPEAEYNNPDEEYIDPLRDTNVDIVDMHNAITSIQDYHARQQTRKPITSTSPIEPIKEDSNGGSKTDANPGRPVVDKEPPISTQE